MSSSFQAHPGRDQRDQRDSRDSRDQRQPRDGRSFYDRRDDGGGFRGPMAVLASGPEYGSHAEAEAAFFKLLRKAGVQPGWSWERTVRATVQDPQYRAIKEPNDRKAAFEKFLDQVVKEDEEREKERVRKLRQDLRTMLASHPEIKPFTRWKTARPILQGEAIFRSSDNDDEKKRLFDDYILDLKKAADEKRQHDYESAMTGVADMLHDLNLSAKSQWLETREQLQNHPEFQQADKYRILTPTEPLQIFDRYMRRLWNDAHYEKQRAAQVKAREQRKARDEFSFLLRELRDSETLKPSSMWKEIRPLVENDPRYTKLLENLGYKDRVTDGSTPKDLFFDVLEAFDREVHDLRDLVDGVLKEQHFRFSPSTTLEEFLAVVKHDRRSGSVNRHLLEEVYKRMHRSALDREEDLERDAKRQQRKAIDALRSRIKHLEPPVILGDTWEQVRARVERSEEYKAVERDDDRQAAFDKHMSRLKDDAAERDRIRRHDRERDRARDERHSSRRDRERDRRRSRTPARETDAYEADRRRAATERERQYGRQGSAGGLSPPPRERRHRVDDRFERDDRDRRERQVSLTVYDRERREREAERERSYISRADPRAKASELDYGDSSDAPPSRPESTSGKRPAADNDSRRQAKVRVDK